MPVDLETKRLLLRWHSLSRPEALQRVRSIALTLWVVGLVVFILLAIAVARSSPPVLIAFGGVVAGWLISETNVLRTRIAQWNTFKRYLDWQRIEQDLKDAT